MAEEIEAGICGSSWWNSSRHALAASPGFNDHMAGSFGCPNDMVDMKAITSSRSSCGETININSAHLEVSDDVHSNSIGYDQYHEDVDLEKPHGSPRPSVLIHSTFQMLGFGLSSSTVLPSDFNQALLLGRNDSMLQEHMGDTNNKLNYPNEDSPSIINGFKPLNQEFSLEQLGSSSSSGFPIISSSSSTSAANSYGFPPTLLQSLFDPEVPQPQQSLFNNSSNNNHFSNNLLLPPSPTSACWPPRYSPSSCLRPSSLPKQLQTTGGAGGGRGGGGGGGGSLHFSNHVNTPCWNAPPSELRANGSHFSSSQSQYAPPPSSTFHEQKPNNSHNNFTSKGNGNEDGQDSSSSIVKKSGSSSSGCEPVFKRARIETPSPLPTFKVRKEKLGDRITALQQLVSPFGKTDTASVLHEAIEYIKFLHDQVGVLSTPYMKNGGPMQHQQAGSDHKMKEVEGARQDLQSRGLCLVPISSTFPVANETTADFWTPTFGATFR